MAPRGSTAAPGRTAPCRYDAKKARKANLTASAPPPKKQKKISDDEKQKEKISDATNKLAAEAAAVF